MGRASGTGYPQYFECAKARLIWYGRQTREQSRRTSEERAKHVVELTGRTKPTKHGKGHPRKSWTTFEYRCSCGHIGWSSHFTLEARAKREGIIA